MQDKESLLPQPPLLIYTLRATVGLCEPMEKMEGQHHTVYPNSEHFMPSDPEFHG